MPGDGYAPRVERFHNEFFVHRRTYQRQRDEYPDDYGHNGKNNVYHTLPAQTQNCIEDILHEFIDDGERENNAEYR